MFSESKTIGVDVEITDFTLMSTSEKVENSKYFKNSLKILKVLWKRVNRKQTDSENREKAE